MRIALWTIVLLINCIIWGIVFLEELMPYVFKSVNHDSSINFALFAIAAIAFCYVIYRLLLAKSHKKLSTISACALLIGASIGVKLLDDLSSALGIVSGGFIALMIVVFEQTRLLRKIKAITFTYDFNRNNDQAFSQYQTAFKEVLSLRSAQNIYVNVYGYLVRLTDMPMINEGFKLVFDRKFNAAQVLCKQINEESAKRDLSDPLDRDFISLLQALVNCEGLLTNEPMMILPSSMQGEVKIQHMVSDAVSDTHLNVGTSRKSTDARHLLAAMIGEATRAGVKNNAKSVQEEFTNRNKKPELMYARLDAHGLLLLSKQAVQIKPVVMPFVTLFVLFISLVALLSESVVKFFVDYSGGAARTTTILQGYNMWMLCFIITVVLAVMLCFLYTSKKKYKDLFDGVDNTSISGLFIVVRAVAFIVGFAILFMPANLVSDYINLREDMAQISSGSTECKIVMIASKRTPSYGEVFILSPAGILDKVKVVSLSDQDHPTFNIYVPHFFKSRFQEADIYNHNRSLKYNMIVKPHYRLCYTTNNRTLARIQKLQSRRDKLRETVAPKLRHL